MVESVDVGFGQTSAVGIRGKAPTMPGERAAFDKGAAFSSFAESVILKLHQNAAGEVVVELGNVYIGRPQSLPLPTAGWPFLRFRRLHRAHL